jgi:hypothetical protein
MNIWDVLKIEQTKDKDALKKAYRMVYGASESL